MKDTITLTEQQQQAACKIKNWYNNGKPKSQIFVLSGYAGTGKTFLIDYLISNILQLKPEEVSFVAPTGKAASVLIQRGRDAETVHRLIYNVVEKENNPNDPKKHKQNIFFAKKESIPNYKLIVVDEISMVDGNVLKDLMSYSIPILCSGDGFQLPPVMKANGLLDHPDVQLTDIVRQSSDNKIVDIATKIRQNQYVPEGDYGDVKVYNRNDLTKDEIKQILLSADQVLCGTNKNRHVINDQIRKYNGIDTKKDKLPIVGEKIIFNVNDWSIFLDDEQKYNLVNGTIGFVKSIKVLDNELHVATVTFKADFLDNITDPVAIDTGNYDTGEYAYDVHQKVMLLNNGKYAIQSRIPKKQDGEDMAEYRKKVSEIFKTERQSVAEEMLEQSDFAYCISVHKSQGSEWDNVVVFDESYKFRESNRWLYTAVTRAKKKLIIIR